jgi:hypothetical protein
MQSALFYSINVLFHCPEQGALTELEGSVQLTSSLR